MTISNTTTIDIRTKKVRYNFELTHRVSIIRGDSGTGKTWLYTLMTDPPPGCQVTCNREI